MKSKHLRILLAVAVTFTLSALAQTGSAATPSAPSATPASPAASGAAVPPVIAGTKVGAINMDGAIFGNNEGSRDLEALRKKFEPKQAELKSQNDELESLKKQLTLGEGKLNEEALASLKKQIETKQKSFDRATQDAQEDFQNQQGEIGNKILTKMAPLLQKYVVDNGYGLVLDTSQPWPRGPVIMAGPAMDITQPIVEAYNVQSGVPAPPANAAVPKPVRPATSKPAAPASKAPASNPPSQ
jgi:outer membrane protein